MAALTRLPPGAALLSALLITLTTPPLLLAETLGK